MLSFLSKKTSTKVKVLAWYQIIGGIVGFLGIFWIIASIDRITWSIFSLILLVLTLYSFSIYSGWLLFKDKCILGLKLSIINQCFQALAFTFVRFTYIYAAGMYLFVTVDTTNGFNLGLKYYLGSEATITFHNEEKPFFLGVNLVALILIGFITKLRDSIKQEKTSFDELEILDESKEEGSAYEGQDI